MDRAEGGRRRTRRPVAAGFAAILVVAGVGVAFAGVPGSEPSTWVSAWVTSTSSRTLMIRALGQDGVAGACGPPQVRLTVTETPTEVRIGARHVRFLGGVPVVRGLPFFGPVGCADVGYGPTPHAIRLARPLGDRRVVDTTARTSRPVLDASAASTITGLPEGLATTDLALESDAGGVPVVRRTWSGSGERGGEFVTLVVAARGGASSRLSGGRTERANGTTVHMSGHQGDPRDVYYLQWLLPSDRQVNVDVHLAHGVWTREQALDIATRTIRIT